MAQKVPHQAQQIVISWIFILASITLFLDFVSLQCLVRGDTSTFVLLNNWFGTVSCVNWFLGFVVLVHWLKRIGAPQLGLTGAVLKLVASVFFNLQPMTGSAGIAGGAGWWWSNLVGILFFHIGNLVSCIDFRLHRPPGADPSKGLLYHGNLPITGMWIYQLATWLLVCSNLLACNWGGAVPSAPWVATDHGVVMVCQYAGALLLLLGSVFFCVWCNGFASLAL
jgi:hypothetical protein